MITHFFGFLLILSSFHLAQANCLQINNFRELASFSDFDDDRAWTLSNVLRTPYELTSLHNDRIKGYAGIDGVRFMLHTRFQGEGLYWETIRINGTGRSYDIYIFEAGDNGAGFIYEGEDTTAPVAVISDHDIIGCLRY